MNCSTILVAYELTLLLLITSHPWTMTPGYSSCSGFVTVVKVTKIFFVRIRCSILLWKEVHLRFSWTVLQPNETASSCSLPKTWEFAWYCFILYSAHKYDSFLCNVWPQLLLCFSSWFPQSVNALIGVFTSYYWPVLP